MYAVDGDIEGRLAAAAEQMREYELTQRRLAELQERHAALAAQITELAGRYAKEQHDVDKLEGLSLTRVLAALRGAREDALARERAEADAARYQVAQAKARQESVEREQQAAQARLAALSGAPDAYAALLDEKESHLRAADDPRAARLLELAGERGALAAEVREIGEARAAAVAAARALDTVAEHLSSARSWSAYDTFFNGGLLSSVIKHDRMDAAARAAAEADQCLLALRTELADVGGLGATAPQLAIDGLTRFLDIWFDNIFTDFAVRERILQAQDNVAHSRQVVADVSRRLEVRETDDQRRLAANEQERRELLISRQ